MRKIYCTKCKRYKEFIKPKASNICDKTLLLSTISASLLGIPIGITSSGIKKYKSIIKKKKRDEITVLENLNYVK